MIINSNSVIAFLISATVALILCYLIIRYGRKFGVYSKVSFRRPKEEQVPLLGGAAIYFAVFFGNLFMQSAFIWKLLLASVPIAVFGVWDDLREAPARFKLAAQFVSALLAIALIGPSELFYTRILEAHLMVGVGLSFLFLLTITNAYNFLDGMDGLLSTIGVIAFFAMGMTQGELFPASVVMISAVLGFLLFNFPPAKIYLGEVGSSFLGLSAAMMALTLPVNDSSMTSFWAVNFIFALPMCDLIMAIYRRLKLGLSPWSPDKEHFHHKLLSINLSKRMALFVVAFISSASSLTGLLLISEPYSNTNTYFSIIVGLCLSCMYLSIYGADKVWGKRISGFGRELILKYVKVDDTPIEESFGDRCVILDLLPYFSELQSRGIAAVDKFAAEIGIWAFQLQDVKAFKLVGSYSVAVILKGNKKGSSDWKVPILTALQGLLFRHRALRHQKATPDGVYFYDNLESEDVRRLLGLGLRSVSFIQNKKASGE